MCDMTQLYLCEMTHSYVWDDSFICVRWRVYMRDMTQSHVQDSSFIFVRWLSYMCDMTHPYVWHDSSICVKWLWHDSSMCDMTHPYVHLVHDRSHKFIYVTRRIGVSAWVCICVGVRWLIHIWDTTHSHEKHDSFMRVTRRIYVSAFAGFHSHAAPSHSARGGQERAHVWCMGVRCRRKWREKEASTRVLHTIYKLHVYTDKNWKADEEYLIEMVL